ncbi:hypothetical protein E2C01_035501 [Portunus trituberculatus]|uniref:Uncharacterized protein n=1 Tax=Portunus trituberculatus TaxID=210409 RepID=A0A5B7F9Y6_PORTR|nr:hypothetical protein [Portunus trituberculatus]
MGVFMGVFMGAFMAVLMGVFMGAFMGVFMREPHAVPRSTSALTRPSPSLLSISVGKFGRFKYLHVNRYQSSLGRVSGPAKD